MDRQVALPIHATLPECHHRLVVFLQVFKLDLNWLNYGSSHFPQSITVLEVRCFDITAFITHIFCGYFLKNGPRPLNLI